MMMKIEFQQGEEKNESIVGVKKRHNMLQGSKKTRRIKRHRTFVHAFLLTRCIQSKRKSNFIPITRFLNKVDIPLMSYALDDIIANLINFILILSQNCVR